MGKLTKSVVQEYIFENHPHLKKELVKTILNELVNVINTQLGELRPVRFTKSGKLVPIFKPGGRPVRNPRTGEGTTMHDVYSVSFRVLESCHSKSSIKPIVNTSELISLVSTSEGVSPYITQLYSKGNRSGRRISPEKYIQNIVEIVIRTFMEMFKKARDNCQPVELRGLGSFHTAPTNQTMSRNPRTGEKFELESPIIRTTFREGALLKKALANKLA